MPNSLSPKILLLRSIYVIVLLVAVVAICLMLAGRIAITLTPSLKYTFFYLDDASTDMVRPGAYVLFKMDNVITRKLKINRVIKEVACAPGEHLSVVEKRYYCNESYLGRAKEISLVKGISAANFVFNGIIPDGSLFVMGHSEDSYDSRYFGFIQLKSVEKIAHPLF